MGIVSKVHVQQLYRQPLRTLPAPVTFGVLTHIRVQDASHDGSRYHLGVLHCGMLMHGSVHTCGAFASVSRQMFAVSIEDALARKLVTPGCHGIFNGTLSMLRC